MTPEEAKQAEEAMNKAIAEMDKKAREQARDFDDKANKAHEKRASGVDLEAAKAAAAKASSDIRDRVKQMGASQEMNIDIGANPRTPAKSWEKIVKDMVQKRVIKDESYATMDMSSAARVSASLRTGNSASLNPGLVKQEDDGKNRVLFIFDNSGSVMAHIQDANAQLWKLISRGQLDDSLLLRFSADFDVFEFYPKDKKAAKMLPKQVAEIAATKKMPKKFEVASTKVPFVSVLAKARGSDTIFNDAITNIAIAALKSNWGVLIFTDSDLIDRSGNISNVKQVVAEGRKHPKKFGVVMNHQDDFEKLINAVGYSPLFTHF